jgi:hypothetical protein
MSVFRQIHDRHQDAAQGDHSLHGRRHVRRRRYRRSAHDLAYLEDIDAVGFMPSGTRVGTQREQEDLELVGARQAGTRIDVLQQIGHVPVAGFDVKRSRKAC